MAILLKFLFRPANIVVKMPRSTNNYFHISFKDVTIIS